MLLRAPGVSSDLFVEVLGTLANLSVPEFDFQALAQRHDLLNFLAQFAEPDAVDDDILLEVIMFLGAPTHGHGAAGNCAAAIAPDRCRPLLCLNRARSRGPL